jgi:hypothetical protein
VILKAYHEQQSEAKQIYNLSNMNYQWKKIKIKIEKIHNLEEELKNRLKIIEDKKGESCNLFAELIS